MLVPIRPGLRGMGDALDDILSGSLDPSTIDQNTVDTYAAADVADAAAASATPSSSWTSSGTSAAPLTTVGTSVGSPSIGTQILSAIFGPSTAMTKGLTTAQLAALKAQQGPSTALIIGGLAVGALAIGWAMRRSPSA